MVEFPTDFRLLSADSCGNISDFHEKVARRFRLLWAFLLRTTLGIPLENQSGNSSGRSLWSCPANCSTSLRFSPRMPPSTRCQASDSACCVGGEGRPSAEPAELRAVHPISETSTACGLHVGTSFTPIFHRAIRPLEVHASSSNLRSMPSLYAVDHGCRVRRLFR